MKRGISMSNLEKVKVENLFDLEYTAAKPLLSQCEYPWEALPKIGEFILSLGATLSGEEYLHPENDLWIAKSAKIFPTAVILGPAIIGPKTEVRPSAFIRGNALVGKNCVIGNSSELKNVIIFDDVQVPHFNYVGDSILGHFAHMGAGSILSNIKQDRKNVVLHVEGESIQTGLRKIGAMIGDSVEIGCNSVLNPGVIIGRRSNIYPLSMVRGYVPQDSIYKKQGEVAEKE